MKIEYSENGNDGEFEEKRIQNEIEELKQSGFDDTTIKAVIKAKYDSQVTFNQSLDNSQNSYSIKKEYDSLKINITQRKVERIAMALLVLIPIILIFFMVIGSGQKNDDTVNQKERTTTTSDSIVKDEKYWRNMEKFLNDVGTSLDPDKREELWMERWGPYYGY